MKEISEPTLLGIVEYVMLLEKTDSSSELASELGVASRLTDSMRLAYRFRDLPLFFPCITWRLMNLRVSQSTFLASFATMKGIVAAEC